MQPKLSQPKTLLAIALSLGLAIVVGFPTPTRARSKPALSVETPLERSTVDATFNPPGEGEPDDTAGSGSRY